MRQSASLPYLCVTMATNVETDVPFHVLGNRDPAELPSPRVMEFFTKPTTAERTTAQPCPKYRVVRAYLHYEVCEEGWSRDRWRSPPYQWVYQSGRILLLGGSWRVCESIIFLVLVDWIFPQTCCQTYGVLT